VDYEVKEAREAGQIESSVIEEVIKRRRETAERQNGSDESFGQPEEINLTKSQYSTGMVDVLEAKKTKDVSDGILAIGRNAYREVMDGLAKGCDASLEVVEEPKIDQVAEKVDSNNVNSTDENTATEQTISESTNNELILNDDTPQQEEGEVVSHFSLPDSFLPVVYVPQVNIIGWSNIPYRLYMWYADYKRIDDVGKYVVAAVLNETRPMEERDANKGEQEKKYWIGEESAEELKKNDQPIKIDDRIIGKLRTFTSEDLP
jgi:import inner membrane translocase subunit TIM54